MLVAFILLPLFGRASWLSVRDNDSPQIMENKHLRDLFGPFFELILSLLALDFELFELDFSPNRSSVKLLSMNLDYLPVVLIGHPCEAV